MTAGARSVEMIAGRPGRSRTDCDEFPDHADFPFDRQTDRQLLSTIKIVVLQPIASLPRAAMPIRSTVQPTGPRRRPTLVLDILLGASLAAVVMANSASSDPVTRVGYECVGTPADVCPPECPAVYTDGSDGSELCYRREMVRDLYGICQEADDHCETCTEGVACPGESEFGDLECVCGGSYYDSKCVPE